MLQNLFSSSGAGLYILLEIEHSEPSNQEPQRASARPRYDIRDTRITRSVQQAGRVVEMTNIFAETTSMNSSFVSILHAA